MDHSIVWLGDSLIHNITLGVAISDMPPAQLARLLRLAGYRVRVRNFGRSGRTTAVGSANMGTRFVEAFQFDANPPAIGIVWGGANDPGNGISTAQTTTNLRAILMGWKFGATAIVAGQASLPATGQVGERQVVLADTSANGGAAQVAVSIGLATIAGAYTDGPSVWECRSCAAGELGWGRVATSETTATHISRLVVVGMQWLNYDGGDTLATAYAAYDDSTGVRKAQIDAAAAEGAVYADVYAEMASRIEDGTETQNSYSWHVENGNQHINEHGAAIVAKVVFDAISAQPGWLAELKKN